MTLILINGYAGAGKDTFVRFFTEFMNGRGKRTVNLSSITPVWDMLKNQGIDMDCKGPEERKLAAEVKAALDNYNFYATQLVLQKAVVATVTNADYVFIHMREPRALQYSKDRWAGMSKLPCKTIFIERNQQELNIGNVADDSVYNFEYDDVVNNTKNLTNLSTEAVIYALSLL